MKHVIFFPFLFNLQKRCLMLYDSNNVSPDGSSKTKLCFKLPPFMFPIPSPKKNTDKTKPYIEQIRKKQQQ